MRQQMKFHYLYFSYIFILYSIEHNVSTINLESKYSVSLKVIGLIFTQLLGTILS